MNGNGKIQKQIEDETKKTITELEPTVHEVIRMISEAKLPIGEIHAHDNAKLDAVAREVLAVCLRNNIRYTDRNLLFKLILQPFDMTFQIVLKSLSESFNHAVDKSFGKSIEELRLVDLDEVLKAVDKQILTAPISKV